MNYHFDSDEIIHWHCPYCDKIWLDDPGFKFCLECGDEEIRSEIEIYTRQHKKEADAERQMDEIKAGENDGL